MGVRKKKPYEIPEDSSSSASDVNSVYFPGDFSPDALGQDKSLSQKIAPRDFSGLVLLIKSGITRASLDQLLVQTGISLSEMASFMHMSERTLRNYSPDTHLGPDSSERAIEIGLLYEEGKEVMGSLQNFIQWMSAPAQFIAGKRPLDFLDTSVGIRFLSDELGRLRHGVFA